MLENDLPEFTKILLATGELYDKVPTAAVIDLYWDDLKDLSIKELMCAVTLCRRDPERGKFMPKPADILHFAKPKRTALIAWVELVEAMGVHGAYQSVRFADTITAAVVRDMGGWPYLCSLDIVEPWTQKEFERRYENYRLAGFCFDGVLPGLIA